jgi:hypothetical protein
MELGGQGMYAVITTVEITDYGKAQKMLHSDVIPMTKQAPGFVTGWWLTPKNGNSGEGMSFEVFESEDDAKSYAQRLEAGPTPQPDLVTVKSAEVREVAGNA